MGKKIMIIGNGGSGKSTLSIGLGKMLDIPVTHLDLMTFSSTGEPVGLEPMVGKLREVLLRDKWIVEGWSYQSTMQERINNADTIIYLAYPLWYCYWNALKRQVKSTFRPDPFSPIRTSLWRKSSYIAKAMWRVHRVHIPEAEDMLSKVKEKYIYKIRSRRVLGKQMKSWETSRDAGGEPPA